MQIGKRKGWRIKMIGKGKRLQNKEDREREKFGELRRQKKGKGCRKNVDKEMEKVGE